MPTITTQIDIAAPPEEVRKAFLDFESYPTWSKAHLRGITVTAGDSKNIKPGDKLSVALPNMSFPASVQVNDAGEFRWLGSIYGIFTGAHGFRFQPSATTPGHTTLVQEEVFTGLLSFLVAPTWSMGKQTQAGFEGFNRELKMKVEEGR